MAGSPSGAGPAAVGPAAEPGGARTGTVPARETDAGWPSRFAQVLAETLAGSRPPRQIAPWTTEQARDHIQRLGAQLSSPQRPRIRRLVTFQPTTDTVEMTVVVGFGARVRALAVRLERDRPAAPEGRRPAPPGWRCTDVEAA